MKIHRSLTQDRILRFGMAGPVWHLMSEWPPNIPKKQLELESFEAWWSASRDEYEDSAYSAAKAAWLFKAGGF